MKTVTHGNLKRRFEKKKTYLMHYQLLEHKAKGQGLMLRLNFFIFAGFYLFWHEYPLALATLDFSFTVLAVLFWLFVKPRMLRGDITAYYRRDYRKMKSSMFLIQLFIQGALMRFAVVALYYALTLYLVKDSPKEIETYQEVVSQILINPTVSMIAIAGFSLAMYVLFYHERYATIREFSNSVVEIYSSHPYTEEGAVNEFIERKDRELRLSDIDGVRYDGAWSTVSSEPESQPVLSEITQAEVVSASPETVQEEPTDIVRRKARR
ncbi:hypothetical protein CVD28_24470 [Bacillus sp. M6-12]|uniref:hypothetical protein n=1 Tax=Bacillus sp. M6-12 TaxID=2054166 RepID=UPI000C783CF0|nr:hypothetical protein [Bacillus sp. M6-12]PLS15038.1 hypothetical protein CVD28_24470 [Bacillus sp. M6-12]